MQADYAEDGGRVGGVDEVGGGMRTLKKRLDETML